MQTPRVLAVVAVLAAAACGPSKEHRLMDQRAATCDALLSQQGVTLADALNALPNSYGFCSSYGYDAAETPGALNASDRCAGAPIYRFLIPFPPSDPGLCTVGPYGQECGFFCLMYATADAVAASGGDPSALPLCAAQWVGPTCVQTNFCSIYYTC